MFWYDKDQERVMQHKKREIIRELEETKNRILKELSGVDKVTLTRLREVLADYNRIDHNINEKIKVFMENGNVVLNGAEEVSDLFREEIKKLDNLEREINSMLGYRPFRYVEEFGAIGDGMTDDTTAFNDAIIYCEENNLELMTRGKTYLVGKVDTPITKINVDFNNATIIPANNDASKPIFTVTNQAKYESLVTTKEMIKNNEVMTDELKGKVFRIETDFFIGERTAGSGGNFYFTTLIATDNQGNIVNCPIKEYDDFTTANISAIHDLGSNITLKNCNVIYSPDGRISSLIHCNRSNTTIKNINVKGSVVDTGSYGGAVLDFLNAYRIKVSEINGCNPEPSTRGGYLICFSCCSDVTMENCNLNDKNDGSWGAIGSHFLTNFMATNCYSSRFDVHYWSCGYFSLNQCTFKRLTFGGGFTKLNINECILVQKTTTPVIILRTDLPQWFFGDITLRDCHKVGRTGSIIEMKCPNALDVSNNRAHGITVDGCTFDNHTTIISIERPSHDPMFEVKFINSTFAKNEYIINATGEPFNITFDKCYINGKITPPTARDAISLIRLTNSMLNVPSVSGRIIIINGCNVSDKIGDVSDLCDVLVITASSISGSGVLNIVPSIRKVAYANNCSPSLNETYNVAII